ncbi:MAG: PAS domain S-box protein [Melioribacteraceae bacterium]|nr:PAS domain S-box protein [Melioribacteraceae bacterium]
MEASDNFKTEKKDTNLYKFNCELSKRSSMTRSSVESEEIYKTIFQNSPLGIIYFDKSGQVQDCNDKFSAIIGVSRDDLLTINLINDLDDKEIIKQIKQTLKSGSGYYNDYYHPVRSNKVTPIIVHFNAIYLEKKIIGGVGLVEDNTTRKEAQTKIKESEHYLKEAQKFSHIGHWKRDFISNELTRSKELLRIYNLDCENPDVPKEVFYNIIHPDDVDNVLEAFANSIKNKNEYNITFRLLFKDGSIKYINEKGRSEYDVEGNPISSMGIIQDVTERKRKDILQAALYKISIEASSDKSLEKLYESIHVIIKELMPADNFYIALYDEETELLSFPYHVDEVDETPEPHQLGNGLSEYALSQKKSLIITEEIDKRLQSEGKVGLSGEYAKLWIGIYLNFESTMKGVLVIQDYNNEKAYGTEEVEILDFVSKQVVRAIDKKYADEKIRKSEKELKKSNANKDKFFSIISHDLKSPFQGIMGMSDLLNESMDELTSEEKTEFHGLLNESIKNVYSLIEQLLEWSRVQTGKLEFKPGKINLKNLFLKVTSLALLTAQKKKIPISHNVDENIFAFADSMMIETVLRNLIANAIKFTTENGNIQLSVSLVEDKVIIKVKDSGIGMTETVRQKLFKIEEHHTSLGTEGEKGTCLGLVLCNDLIEKNNGEIWVESEFRIGSSFFFKLPIGNINE